MSRRIGPMQLPLAVLLGSLIALLIAAPANAATTGTLCGEITAFTAPSGGTDGSISINGTDEDIAATAAVDTATTLTLDAVAAAGATTCVEIEADGAGVIIALDIAAQVGSCGTATIDATTGAYAVGDVLIPEPLVAVDAELAAVLDAAVSAGANVCADVTLDTTTGVITSVSLTATIDLCGDVTLTATGEVVVDGTIVPDDVLTAELRALLEMAAEADAEGCVSIDATSTNGNTSLGVDVELTICATVTAITDSTITIGDVTFDLAGGVDADVEVGDEVCAVIVADEGSDPVVSDVGPDVAGQGPASDDGTGLLPDTAVPATVLLTGLGGLLVMAGGIGYSARRRMDR